MKHVLIVNDETQQGKLVMELINAIKPSDDAIHFVDETEREEELIPADVVFAEFKRKLVLEVERKHKK